MKIVYILRDLAMVGGIERVTSEKVNYLAKLPGVEVHVIFLFSTAEHKVVYPLDKNVNIHFLSFSLSEPYKYRLFRRLIKLKEQQRQISQSVSEYICKIGADIVVFNYQGAKYVVKNKLSAKLIFESHTASQFLYIDYRRRTSCIIDFYHKVKIAYWYRMIKKHTDCVVCLTNGDATDNWNDTRMSEVIPNITEYRDQIPYDLSSRCAIAAGRLVDQKRFDLLIRAWKDVAIKHPDWQLCIYGEGENEMELRSLISSLSLDDQIKILPFTNELHYRMQQSAFYILSSQYEGFGLVLAEAMMNGLPVVSFNCNYGPSDLIKGNGILVEPENVSALSEAINKMIEHPDERQLMSQRSYVLAQNYTWDNIKRRWFELFDKLLK